MVLRSVYSHVYIYCQKNSLLLSSFSFDNLCLFFSEKLTNIVSILQSEEYETLFIEIEKFLRKHYHRRQSFYISYVKFLAAVLPPLPSVWKQAFNHSSVISNHYHSYAVLTVVKALVRIKIQVFCLISVICIFIFSCFMQNETECAVLEELTVTDFSDCVLLLIENEDMALFIDRLSTHRISQILEKIETMTFPNMHVRDILIYFGIL